jgi:hypothetical protein
MSTVPNKRGAGKGGLAVLWRAGRAWPALPDLHVRQHEFATQQIPSPCFNNGCNPVVLSRVRALSPRPVSGRFG